MPPYAPTQPVAPAPYTQPAASNTPAQGQPGQFAYNESSAPLAPRKRRWPRRTLISLLVIVVLVVGGWFVVARPILHSYAQSQIDQEISSDLDNVLPVPPPIDTIPAHEAQINNLIVLNTSSGGPVQNGVVHISPPTFASDGSYTGGVQFTFTLYGFACSITAIPQASNGDIIVTHMQVSGIIGLIMSADELTSDLNTQLQAVKSHLLRSISSVTLKSGEIDIGLT